MAKRSSHQDRIIRNYYEHHDEIMVQRLGELATDLFLAEGKKRAGLWKRVEAALKNLKVPAEQIEHLVNSDNPTLVANLIQQMWQKKPG